jgi:hypothetical protein
LGWALAGSGLQQPKPDPKLRAGPGFGLEPGLMSQRGNWLKYYIKIQFSMPECTHGQPYNSTHHESCQVACARNHWPTGGPKWVYTISSSVISSRNLSKMHKFSTCHRYVSPLTNVYSFGIPQLTECKFICNTPRHRSHCGVGGHVPISTTGSKAGHHNVYGRNRMRVWQPALMGSTCAFYLY